MIEEYKRRFKQGFTLIELLMVMAVLAAMTTIFLNTFPASQRRARDARRRNDLHQYQVALETYANANSGFYPERYAASGQPAHSTLCSDLGLSDCPADPRDNQNSCNGEQCRYRYQTENINTPACNPSGQACATRHVLWARFEQPNDSGNTIFFVICSNGKTGEATSGVPATTAGNCPI